MKQPLSDQIKTERKKLSLNEIKKGKEINNHSNP